MGMCQSCMDSKNVVETPVPLQRFKLVPGAGPNVHLAPCVPAHVDPIHASPCGELIIEVKGLEWLSLTNAAPSTARQAQLQLQQACFLSLQATSFETSMELRSNRIAFPRPSNGNNVAATGTSLSLPSSMQFVCPLLMASTEVGDWINQNNGSIVLALHNDSESLQYHTSYPLAIGVLDLKDLPSKRTYTLEARVVPPTDNDDEDEVPIATIKTTLKLALYGDAGTREPPMVEFNSAIRNASPQNNSTPTVPQPPARQQGRIPARHVLEGIRQTTAATRSTGAVNIADFTREAASKVNITMDGSEVSVEVKAYAPKAFAAIRSRCNVSDADFANAWVLPENKINLALGAGRSGSLFLRSNDNKYLLKTIPHDEVITFMGLLHNFYEHLVSFPDSMIMRVFAMHRFQWGFSTLYTLIFCNVLYCDDRLSPEVEVFDLKGREVKPGKALQRRHDKGTVWKDKDLERFFYLTNSDRAKWQHQLNADVQFLQFNNMMDYSFLVGVREIPLALNKEEELAKETGTIEGGSIFRNQFGGMVSNNAVREVYYMGIIDCLTSYSGKKKVANLCKSFVWEQSSLSTVPSQIYAERFSKFMLACFPTEEQTQSPDLLRSHPNTSFFAAASVVPFTPFGRTPVAMRSRRSFSSETGPLNNGSQLGVVSKVQSGKDQQFVLQTPSPMSPHSEGMTDGGQSTATLLNEAMHEAAKEEETITFQ